MEKKLLLLGGGGHCTAVIDTILSSNILFDKISLVDLPEKVGSTLCGLTVVGSDQDLPALRAQGYTHAFVTLGSVGNPQIRIKLYHTAKALGFLFPNIIDSSAVVSERAQFGEGIFISKKAVINTGVQLGDCAIINTGAIVEHQCQIGSFSHVAPGATLCGNVIVGQNTHIGAGSVIKQGVCIGENSLVGLGSVVLKSIGKRKIAYGNPCKEVQDV